MNANILRAALTGLEIQRTELQNQINEVETALNGLATPSAEPAAPKTRGRRKGAAVAAAEPKKRGLSKRGRAAIGDAAKARWAKARAVKAAAAPAAETPAPAPVTDPAPVAWREPEMATA